MVAAQGILTVRGGMTSHAAVVARGMGTCCVSGCGEIKMDEENKKFELGGKTYVEGDYLSLDGSTGNIYGEAIPTVDASIAGEFGRIMAWADQFRTLKVRTNADNPVMLNRLGNSVLRVLVCAVRSICSLRLTESLPSVR